MSGNHQIGRDDCYICGRGHPDVLQRHHIVPRRYGGSDDPKNLVDLCPTCHSALEKLYGQRFYRTLGMDVNEFTIASDENDVENDTPGHEYENVDFSGTLSKSERILRDSVLETIDKNEDVTQHGAPLTLVLDDLERDGHSPERGMCAINELKRLGEVYDWGNGPADEEYLRTV